MLAGKVTVAHLCTSPDFLRYLGNLLEQLHKDGFRVHVITHDGASLRELQRLNTATTHVAPLARRISVRADVTALLQIIFLLKRLAPDIVHAHTPKAGLLGMCAARIVGARAIYHVHGVRYETARGAMKRLLQLAETASCALSHQVVCVSPSVQNRLISDSIVLRQKTRVLSCGSAQGIDVAKQKSYQNSAIPKEIDGLPDSSRYLFYAGRLAGDKGLLELQLAWNLISETYPEVHLILAGSEDPTDPVPWAVWKNPGRVHLLGQVENTIPLLYRSEIVVLPSHREGLPQLALEAGVAGKPFVGTDVTGTRDVIAHEETGLLGRKGCSRELAENIVRLLNDPREGQRMGRKAQQVIEERFRFDEIYQGLLTLYNQPPGDSP